MLSPMQSQLGVSMPRLAITNIPSTVTESLTRIDGIRKKVSKTEAIVTGFLKILEEHSFRRAPLILGAHFLGVGSAFDGTAVEEDVCFDSYLVLPPPFTMSSFKAVQVEPGVFNFLCTDVDNFKLEPFLNNDGYLDVADFRKDLFDQMCRANYYVRFGGYKISISVRRNRHRDFSSKLVVKFSKPGFSTLSVNLIPVMKGIIPGYDDSDLPEPLKNLLDDTYASVFSLIPPNSFEAKRCRLNVFASFCLLEKEALLKNENIRDAVCLTKYIAKCRGWDSEDLTTFHIKNAVLNAFAEIIRLEHPWQCLKRTLEVLSSMLKKGEMSSVFIPGQNVCIKDPEHCHRLAMKMDAVIMSFQL